MCDTLSAVKHRFSYAHTARAHRVQLAGAINGVSTERHASSPTHKSHRIERIVVVVDGECIGFVLCQRLLFVHSFDAHFRCECENFVYRQHDGGAMASDKNHRDYTSSLTRKSRQ